MLFPMTPLDPQLLIPFARKYIWWMTQDEAVTMPDCVAAQVMNIGDYDNVQALVTLAGDSYLRAVLRKAEIVNSRRAHGPIGTIGSGLPRRTRFRPCRRELWHDPHVQTSSRRLTRGTATNVKRTFLPIIVHRKEHSVF